MSKPANSKAKRPLAGQAAVAKRLREVRREEGFSLGELAAETGLSKSQLAHYERDRAPISFAAGNALCQRLDLNQRWLATGEQPQRPFLYSSDLAGEDAKLPTTGRLTFFDAVTGPLKLAFERWRETHDDETLVTQTLRGGIAAALRKMSASALEAQLARFVSELRGEKVSEMKAAHRERIRAVLAEMDRRGGGKTKVDETPTTWDVSPVQIAKQLKSTRKRLGLSQAKAAKQWGIPLKTLQSWEQEERTPRGLGLKQLKTILREASVE